jgi:hypothetical protein
MSFGGLPTHELLLRFHGGIWWLRLQKDFVDPAMASPMLVAGGEAVVPAVAEAVAVARERGIFVVWVIPFNFLLLVWFLKDSKFAAFCCSRRISVCWFRSISLCNFQSL